MEIVMGISKYIINIKLCATSIIFRVLYGNTNATRDIDRSIFSCPTMHSAAD